MGFLTDPHKNDLQFWGLSNTCEETCSQSKNDPVWNGGEIWEEKCNENLFSSHYERDLHAEETAPVLHRRSPET